MTALTNAERDKFAAYLEQNAKDDSTLAEQCERIGEQAVAKKLRVEAMAARVISQKLRETEFQSVSIDAAAPSR